MTRPSARHGLPRFTDPYAQLLEERTVLLGTPIDDASANEVTARLLHLEHEAPDRDVSLCINSPGGSFAAMTAVYDTMRFIGCEVRTVCLGRAASVAAVLLAAGAPGKRYALPGAHVLIRQPSLPEAVRGQVSDLARRAGELTRTRARLEEMLARHTGQDRERIAADIERDRTLDARAALAYGLVDRIVPDRGAVPGTSGTR
ncbi:ATP-dependent Clp protease proteolytic subunit [Streptomyces sp. 8P21H-1]|uniref:ATP-dependent Clp protease proteolytic subunit n=1 Tax=Streptomyces sp. 8P21H-1 TaxID=2737048 RepID=UPI001570314A|nr:ATP-dependent Clp protease proteolytic subunit [Streptomyces sp. 8P21H-1]NSL42768.1 ATP-dependent Clp protease proteolytic subunit [Streptomyces sp. 8P21H-1]